MHLLFGNREGYAGSKVNGTVDEKPFFILVFKAFIDVVDTDALVFFGLIKEAFDGFFTHSHTVIAAIKIGVGFVALKTELYLSVVVTTQSLFLVLHTLTGIHSVLVEFA